MDHVKTLRSALYTASMLNAFQRNPQVRIANFSQLTSFALLTLIGAKKRHQHHRLTANQEIDLSSECTLLRATAVYPVFRKQPFAEQHGIPRVRQPGRRLGDAGAKRPVPGCCRQPQRRLQNLTHHRRKQELRQSDRNHGQDQRIRTQRQSRCLDIGWQRYRCTYGNGPNPGCGGTLIETGQSRSQFPHGSRWLQ